MAPKTNSDVATKRWWEEYHRCRGVLVEQLRTERGWTEAELAKRSRVAIGTIRRMESFDGEVGARTSTLSQVQKALERAGVEFLNDGQPGVRLKPQPH